MTPEEIESVLRPLNLQNDMVIPKSNLLSFIKTHIKQWLALYILFSHSDNTVAFSYVKKKVEQTLALEHGEGILDDEKRALFQTVILNIECLIQNKR